MSVYEYFCEKCEKIIEKDFDFTKNPDTVKCECGENCNRYYGGSVNVVFMGGDWPGKTIKTKNEMTRKNKVGGSLDKKMRQNHQPIKLIKQD